MFAIIALALLVLVALAVVGVALHLLFSPFVLVAIIAVVAWVKLRPNRSRR